MVFKQIVIIINFFLNILSMICNQIIVHSTSNHKYKKRIITFKFSLLVCVSVCVLVQLLDNLQEHWC
jgi:hypothetical protein